MPAIFTDFLNELECETKEKFIKALTERELMDFSSSKEEFRVATGRTPEVTMRKTSRQADAEPEEGLREKIQERFDEFMREFPQETSFDALGRKARELTQPQVNVTVSLTQIREMAGTENPRLKEADDA